MIAVSATVETSHEAPSLSVIIPVYNSEAILPALIARLGPVLHALGRRFEVILVNDGSRDASWNVISRLEREHRWIRSIDLMRNYGQHNALLAGSGGNMVITLDDLQHPRRVAQAAGLLDEGFGTRRLWFSHSRAAASGALASQATSGRCRAPWERMSPAGSARFVSH